MNKNSKILITGANGYIGNCLFYLLKEKFEVIGIDKFTTFNNKIYKSNNKRHKTIVNSAGAGDGFNAHYIATFLKTNNINLALKQGHNIGSKIVKHRSAIIP